MTDVTEGRPEAPPTAGVAPDVAGFPPEVAAELDAVTGNLNDTYGDTVLLLARFVGGTQQAVAATLERVDPSGAEVAVQLADGSAGRTRLTFSTRVQTVDQAQGELYGMLARARAAAGDTVPATSLERELAALARLPTFVTTVAGVDDVAPGLRQITFRGGLEAFTPLADDQYFWVMVPHTPQVVIDDAFTMAGRDALPEEARPAAAYYTVRRWRPDAGELDLWFVIGHHDGPVGAWASRAVPGQRVALWGPRCSYRPPDTTTDLLLVGDETALAAIAAILERRDPDLPAHVVVEATDPDHRVTLPGGAGVTTRWVFRGDAPPGTGTRLVDAVRDLDLPANGLYAFGAAESRQINAVRRHLRRERGMPAARVRMTGYWRRDT